MAQWVTGLILGAALRIETSSASTIHRFKVNAMQPVGSIPNSVWLLLVAGPILFLLAIIGASVWLSVRGLSPDLISQRVPMLIPHILLSVLVCLGILTALLAPVNTVWMKVTPNKALVDMLIGLIVGTLLAVAYLKWLAPLLETAQRVIGDYVPPGAVLPSISKSIGIFFIANVLLAPLVEETLFRGYALPLLGDHLGTVWAVIITCVFFGLLHWAGGFWYIVLTGTVAGGAFAALALWRGGVIAPFAAHLALNLIEFSYSWWTYKQG